MRVLDRLDVHILRMLYQGWPVYPLRPGVRLPYRQMGRQLGVAEGTVRNRMRKFLATGLLRGTSVLVNPALVGLRMGACGFDVSPALDKREVVERLKRADGVIGVQDHHGSSVGVIFVYRVEEEQRALSRLKRLTDSPVSFFGRFQFPPCTLALGDQDWGLILCLLSGDFGTYGQLAAKSGFAVRTLKRRMSAFVESAVVFSLPRVSLGAVENGVPADLMVKYGERTPAEGKVLKIIDDFAFYTGTSVEGFGLYDLILPNPAAASRILDEVKLTEGVKEARIDFVDEHFDRHEVLTDFVTGYVARKRGSRRASPA